MPHAWQANSAWQGQFLNVSAPSRWHSGRAACSGGGTGRQRHADAAGMPPCRTPRMPERAARADTPVQKAAPWHREHAALHTEALHSSLACYWRSSPWRAALDSTVPSIRILVFSKFAVWYSQHTLLVHVQTCDREGTPCIHKFDLVWPQIRHIPSFVVHLCR